MMLKEFGRDHIDTTFSWMGGGRNSLKYNFLFDRCVTYTDHMAWFEKMKNDRSQRIWAIEYDRKHIGNIGLKNYDEKCHKAEVWIYVGDESFRGQGLASKAIRELSEYASSIGLHKLYANIATWNIPSLKAFSNAGFVQEGVLKDEIFFDEQYVTIIRKGLILGERR